MYVPVSEIYLNVDILVHIVYAKFLYFILSKIKMAEHHPEIKKIFQKLI